MVSRPRAILIRTLSFGLYLSLSRYASVCAGDETSGTWAGVFFVYRRKYTKPGFSGDKTVKLRNFEHFINIELN
jgi:hypothetical protein